MSRAAIHAQKVISRRFSASIGQEALMSNHAAPRALGGLAALAARMAFVLSKP